MGEMLQTSSPAASSPSTGSRIGHVVCAYAPALRRFLVIAAIAWWLGGFTFYAGVAVPMGMEVLGSHKVVGFVTERVTNWLNVGGVIALLILLWNTALSWKSRGKWVRNTLLITWLLMAAIEVELIVLHPVMDRLLTTHPYRMILDEDRFEFLHHVYLISSSVQWGIGLLHVWCLCLAWVSRGTSVQPEMNVA
ncbi:MAG TPA: hypothetical protein VGI81_04365 [Tepidisphaeraceae bacterium]|jgi:hypothetical protein